MHPDLLIVSATGEEAAPLLRNMNGRETGSPNLYSGNADGRSVDVLICGIGAPVATFRLTRLLSQRTYGRAVSIGIAGAFTDDIAVGETVQIVEDCFADLGIDDNGTFLSLREAGLAKADEFPFADDFIINPSPTLFPYRNVRGITVGTTSGSERRINHLVDQYRPETETMENAAFFYVCRMMQIPFTSLRTISNRVEPRNRRNWQIQQAIDHVNAAVTEYIRELHHSY